MNGTNEANPLKCARSIDAAILADYWLAALPPSDEAAVEEHLFECDTCGQRLREVIALVEDIRQLAREGSLRMVVSDAFLKRAAEEGLRIRQYAPPSGGSVQCTVTAEDDLLIGRLAADLSGVTRVDLCIRMRPASNNCGCPIFPFIRGRAASSTRSRSHSRKPRRQAK
jgi:hypothetical protein